MAAEVPGNVLTAIRLMYVGFAVTALDLVLSLMALGRYTHDAKKAQEAAATYTALREFGRAAAQTAIMHNQDTMAGAMVIGVVAAALGLVSWACLAVGTRRGNGRTRVAGTVLLAIYSVCTLIVLFGTHRDPGAQFTTVVVWAIGVAAVVPLWSQRARDFFHAWRKR
jgi:drug/metabolite transporter (DMT)-like permease